MYYIHPQLENDTFDNGLLCAVLVRLACFQFLGLSNPNDKEAQKNAGTTATSALENSSHTECPFSHFEDTRGASLLPASYRAFPAPPQELAANVYGLGTLSSSKFWILTFPNILFPLWSCLSRFSPWTFLSYIKYFSLFLALRSVSLNPFLM